MKKVFIIILVLIVSGAIYLFRQSINIEWLGLQLAEFFGSLFLLFAAYHMNQHYLKSKKEEIEKEFDQQKQMSFIDKILIMIESIGVAAVALIFFCAKSVNVYLFFLIATIVSIYFSTQSYLDQLKKESKNKIN